VNKSELVAKLTDRLGGDRAIATAAVNGVLEEISNSVARGERVSLIGFGTFDRRERAARTGRNPQTGAAIQLAASVAPTFRPSAGFRSLLTPNGALTAVQEAVTAVVPPIVVSEAAVAEKKPKKAAKKAAAVSAAKPAKKTAAAASAPKAGKKTAAAKAPKKATAKNAKDGKKAAKKAR
jgi:DNA-binding protein HU-beta